MTSIEHFNSRDNSRTGKVRSILEWIGILESDYIDPNDPRDYGGMTFDLSCEPDADWLLKYPEEEKSE